MESGTQWDPVRQGGLHGPHFSTAGWDQEFRVGKAPGLHPVEMLARIAKFEVRPLIGNVWMKHVFRGNLNLATSLTHRTFEAVAALGRSASRFI